MYEIYKITSPSGRSYVGLTTAGLKERFRQHKQHAKKFPDHNHPFYNAIRKYGIENFTASVIDTCETQAEAQELEKHYIALEKNPYNVSEGGEDDGRAASRVFWNRMNADPQAKKEYLEKLSKVKKENDWSDYEELGNKAKKWRTDNPRKAYYLSRRSSRIAQRINSKCTIERDEEKDLKTRLLWKWKRGVVTRKNALLQWENKTEEEKLEIWNKISEKQKAAWSEIKDPQERSKKTEKARECIDRDIQGKAASSGLKQFWEELRRDPVAYQEYISRRSKTLSETQKAIWAEINDPQERSKKTEKARECIDRDIQGKAASSGLKRFWEELRKDPIAYQEYISKKTEAMKKTRAEKN